MDNGFAQTIRIERERLRLTQSAFSDLIGCSLATLKRWESGQAVPNASRREATFQAIQHGSAPIGCSSGFHAGWWLRIARNRKQLTIREAAAATETSPSAWHRYEAGVSSLGTQQAINYSLALGMRTEELPMATDSPEEEIARAQNLQTMNPAEGLRLVVSALMSIRSDETDPVTHSMLGNGHACLGRLLISTGDYSLGGLAFSEAVRLLHQRPYDLKYDRTNVYLATAWSGFRVSGSQKKARARMGWVESQMTKIPRREVAGYCMPRAIYADQAGRPDIAAAIIRESRRMPSSTDGSQSYTLLSAWLRAKYGDPRAAISRIAPLLEVANVSTKFAAHKIALDAHVNLRAWTDARQHYQALRNIESECGIRLTGYSAAKLRALEA